jgi:hypothetical protein
MYEEIIGALAEQFEHQQLVTSYCIQLKTRIQIIYEALHEFANAIEQTTHRTLTALHKDHVHRQAGKAFVNDTTE